MHVDPYYEGQRAVHSDRMYAANPHFQPGAGDQGVLFEEIAYARPHPTAHLPTIQTAWRGEQPNPHYREAVPTGYSPQRSAEVDAALGGSVDVSKVRVPGATTAKRKEVRQRQVNRLSDAIKRSTIPVTFHSHIGAAKEEANKYFGGYD